MHHRAVPIALNVRQQALMRSAEAHPTHLGCGQGPAREAIKGSPEEHDALLIHEVHEGIAQIRMAVEVAGQIEEVEVPVQPMVF